MQRTSLKSYVVRGSRQNFTSLGRKESSTSAFEARRCSPSGWTSGTIRRSKMRSRWWVRSGTPLRMVISMQCIWSVRSLGRRCRHPLVPLSFSLWTQMARRPLRTPISCHQVGTWS